MWSLGVVVAPPCFDDDLCLGEAVEDLAVEQFVAKLRVEALAVAVLPRAARLDERGLGADSCNPLSHSLGDELRPLSERTWPGTPRRMNRSDRASMTSVELSLRSMRIARHSRVNSSMMLSMRNFLPLWVRPSTKS